MNVLAIDTASRTCSVAVCEDAAILAEITDGSGDTHSRHLLDMVDRVLTMSGVGLAAIDALAVNRGPGSFTGIRIGISTAKGLASAAGIPLVGISGLAALAWQVAPSGHLICPMLDARRQEVYCARYRFEAGRLACMAPETVCAPEDAVRGVEEPCLLIGDGALAYQSRLQAALRNNFKIVPSFQHPLRAGAVAFAAHPQLKQGQNELEKLVPVYLRPSYAQEPVDNQGVNR